MKTVYRISELGGKFQVHASYQHGAYVMGDLRDSAWVFEILERIGAAHGIDMSGSMSESHQLAKINESSTVQVVIDFNW